jgi:hypothetical protein
MKRILPLPLAVVLFALASLRAEDPKPVVPHPVTETFHIANVATDKDVASISEALQKVKSFTKIEGLTPASGYANVSFDSHANSYAEVAQAITNADGAGGKKYDATIRIRVPDYAKEDNAAKVDQVFAASKAAVTVETTDKDKGEFIVHFLPFKIDPSKTGPQGWNLGRFFHPIHDPAPKGLGLAVAAIREGPKTQPK